MANFSVRRNAGPMMGVAGGVFVVGFGVLWTVLAFVITADAPFPLVHLVFPLFGILFVLVGSAAMVGAAYSAAQVNKIGVLDTPTASTRPSPIAERPMASPFTSTPMPTPPAAPAPSATAPLGSPQRLPVTRSLIHCGECGEPKRVGGRFCSRCGTPVNDRNHDH